MRTRTIRRMITSRPAGYSSFFNRQSSIFSLNPQQPIMRTRTIRRTIPSRPAGYSSFFNLQSTIFNLFLKSLTVDYENEDDQENGNDLIFNRQSYIFNILLYEGGTGKRNITDRNPAHDNSPNKGIFPSA